MIEKFLYEQLDTLSEWGSINHEVPSPRRKSRIVLRIPQNSTPEPTGAEAYVLGHTLAEISVFLLALFEAKHQTDLFTTAFDLIALILKFKRIMSDLTQVI